MKRLFVPGVFDVFHVGHLNYLKNAAQFGDHIIVGVQEDRAVFKCKGVKPVIPLAERMCILESLRFVDEVVSYTNVFQGPLLEGLDIDVFAVGEEYGQDDRYPDQKKTLAYCAEQGIEVARVQRTLGVSSTNIRGRLKEFWNSRADKVQELSGGVTVLGSFQGDQNKVINETKHEVEMILQACGATKGKSLLDLGCGDGRQLVHLCGQFQHVVGVDFSPKLLEIARQRIADTGSRADLYEGDVSTFRMNERFDVLLLSGIIPCLDDTQMQQMLENLNSMAKPDATLLVRSSIALAERINVVNQFSEELKSRYTAFYRTIPEITAAFDRIGWTLHTHEKLYQHRADTAVWWFELERQAAVAPSNGKLLAGPHTVPAEVTRCIAETFRD